MPQQYETYKMNERYRKLKKVTENSDIIMETTETNSPSIVLSSPSSSSIPKSSFSTKQSLHRSLSRVNNILPKSPHKKVEVIEKLAEKYQVKFAFKKAASGRPRKSLIDEEKEWLIEFLARADMTYTNPGRKDNVYIGKIDGERVYKQKLYLLWNIRDILDIANGSGKIDIYMTLFRKVSKTIDIFTIL